MKKKNLALIISIIVLLLIAVAAFLIGCIISGADIITWIKSRYAITIYIGIALILLLAGILFAQDAIRNKL